MRSLRRFILDIVILLAIISTIFYIYRTYGNEIWLYLFGEQQIAIFINDLLVSASVADDQTERAVGLSGMVGLGDLEGKFFIFDTEDYYGMWMKDMSFAIDIIWVNDDFKIVHIEENISPATFPLVYTSIEPARFVLETNAYFVDTFKIQLGDTLSIPATHLPADLRSYDTLQ